MIADEPMTGRRRVANSEAKERRGNLNIDTWGAESCAGCGRPQGQVKGLAEIAHYRGAVEREPR